MRQRKTSLLWHVFAIISAVVAMTGDFNAIITVAFLGLAASLSLVDIYRRKWVRSLTGSVVWWKMGLAVFCVCLAFTLFGWWIWPKPVADKQEQPPVYQLPSTGNLADRASALSNKIMEDLYFHGWKKKQLLKEGRYPPEMLQDMPTDSEGLKYWSKCRSAYFSFRFLEEVVRVRNEFWEFHLKNETLDNKLELLGITENIKGEMIEKPNLSSFETHFREHIGVLQIEEIAEIFKTLAEQVKKYEP